MAHRFVMLSTLALLPLASARAQVAPPAAAAPPIKTAADLAAEQAQAAADRREMEAREEEALSRPASWAPMSLAELEKSIGGRTMVEVKAHGVTLEEVADSMRAQSKLDIFTQQQILPPQQNQAQNRNRPQPPTYSFDISRRPLWEAVRALSIAHTAWDRAQGRRPWDNASYGSGRSIFGDVDYRQSALFPTPSPFRASMLALSPVAVVRPDPPTDESLARMAPDMTPERKADMLRSMATPRTQAASPRAAGVLWQLGPSSSYNGGDISQGRASSSWPCLFVIDAIERRQRNSLAPDASEAPPTPPPAAPPAAPRHGAGPRPDAPEVLAGARPVVVPRGEWQQNMALQMRAYVEPRLRGFRNVRMVVDEASDESGRDLRREDFAKPRRVRLGEGADLSLPIALQMPVARGDKSTRLHLRGALLFWVPARITTTELTLDGEGSATSQAILWGQAAGMKMKLARGHNGSWVLSSTVDLNGDHGQLDFRREMGPALNDDDSYQAGLTMPGGVRVVGADGREWKLRPAGEDQQLTLNAGVNMISRKTDYVGSFRRARNAEGGTFHGNITVGPGGSWGGAWGGSGAFASIPGSGPWAGAGRPNQPFSTPPVPPDGFAYQETVTWQLEPSNGAGAAGATGGAGAEPPAIAKIFFDAPQEWREVRVPFEFKDLPLPPA